MSARAARGATWILGLILADPCLAAGLEPRRYEFRQAHMGSEFKLVLYSPDEPTARRASDAAFARIAQLDAILSDYDPQSEVMRLSEKAGGPPVPVGDDLFRVLRRSLEIHEKSGGAFDPTVNPVVRLWRRAGRTRRLPDPVALKRALILVGADQVRLDPHAQTVQLLKPGMKLDFGGIAKGYASGEAIEVLRRLGINRALVAGSGDIVVGDPPPGEEGWRIGIGPLDAPDAQPSRFLILRNAAVSTSGDSEKYVEIDGKRYAHIVDPRTGLGVVDRCSVTVVARDGATADGLDTAVFVLGPERGLELVEATEGAAAYIARRSPEGMRVFTSKRMDEFLIPPTPGLEPSPLLPPDGPKSGSGSGLNPREGSLQCYRPEGEPWGTRR